MVILLRKMQFYAHIAHNVLGGATFFQDHEFLGELYQGYEADYDSLVERAIGLGEDVDLVEIHKDAVEGLVTPTSYEQCFKELLKYEKELCLDCEEVAKDSTLGTNNLIAGIADKSEARQYKMTKRVKG